MSFGFTYENILQKAAHNLYQRLEANRPSIPENGSLYRDSHRDITIGKGVVYVNRLTDNGPADRTYTLGVYERNDETYTPPTDPF